MTRLREINMSNTNNIYQHNQLEERQDTPLVLNNSDTANIKDKKLSKLNVACRSGNTVKQQAECRHTIFVLSIEGNPLTPTTPSKARKLLKSNQAKKAFNKFNEFGIQMLVETRKEVPKTSLGYDPGTKFEGFSVVVDKENNLNIKLDLPAKSNIVKKLKERGEARRTRRQRLRRRKARFNNRSRKGFIAPSQLVIICSRLKILKELIKCYPISIVGMEDVCFNHAKYRWGSNFSTIEIGKSLIRKFFKDSNIELIEFKGWETKEIREGYGYKKSKDKGENIFTSHCSDSLSLALEINRKESLEPRKFIVVDDKYRYIRRKIDP